MGAAGAEPVDQVVCIGASWGGVAAIRRVLEELPTTFAAPICIVQHRPDDQGTLELVRGLRRSSALPVCEPEDKEPLQDGVAYVAPAGYHLLLEDGHAALSTEDRVRWARPSADVLFESAAESYGPGTTAVVLTGANDDGCRGAHAVREVGGHVIVQDPDGAEQPEMPRSVVRAGWASEVLPLDAIAGALLRRVGENAGT